MLFELLAGFVQVLRMDIDMRVVLFTPIPRYVIGPWHDLKAGCNWQNGR